MPTIETHISQFNVGSDGVIHVRKTRTVFLDGAVIATSYWRTVLQPNDPNAESVLSAEPYFLNLAQQAWANLPGNDNA